MFGYTNEVGAKNSTTQSKVQLLPFTMVGLAVIEDNVYGKVIKLVLPDILCYRELKYPLSANQKAALYFSGCLHVVSML